MKTVLFFIILFAANVIQAVTGFAGTLLAMPVSIQLIGVLEAKVILNIMAFASCLWITVQNRRYIQYKILGKIILWMGIGMIAGVWIFDRVSLDFLLTFYGVFILMIALKKLLLPGEFPLPGWLLTVSLLAAGIIHGMFVSGEDFDLTFGLMHTVEKSAEILVKVLSVRPDKLQTITPQNFRDLAVDFKVTLPEKFLYEK